MLEASLAMSERKLIRVVYELSALRGRLTTFFDECEKSTEEISNEIAIDHPKWKVKSIQRNIVFDGEELRRAKAE